jgi:hypothetical protein
MHHRILVLFAIKLNLQDLFVNLVLALFGDVGDCAAGTGWEENVVFGDEGVFKGRGKDITTGDVVANAEIGGRSKVPRLDTVEGVCCNAAGDVDALGNLADGLEGTLDPIVDTFHQT